MPSGVVGGIARGELGTRTVVVVAGGGYRGNDEIVVGMGGGKLVLVVATVVGDAPSVVLGVVVEVDVGTSVVVVACVVVGATVVVTGNVVVGHCWCDRPPAQAPLVKRAMPTITTASRSPKARAMPSGSSHRWRRMRYFISRSSARSCASCASGPNGGGRRWASRPKARRGSGARRGASQVDAR